MVTEEKKVTTQEATPPAAEQSVNKPQPEKKPKADSKFGKWFKKHWHLVTFLAVALVLVVLGTLFNQGLVKGRAKHARQQAEKAKLKALLTANDKAYSHYAFEEVEFVETLDGVETKVVGRYLVYAAKEAKEPAYFIYEVATTGNAAGMGVAIAIDCATHAVIDYYLNDNNETPEYLAKITGNAEFKERLQKTKLENEKLTVEAVSGATKSSEGIVRALTCARNKYAADNQNFTVVPAKLEIIEYAQNYETLNIEYKVKYRDKEQIVEVKPDKTILTADADLKAELKSQLRKNWPSALVSAVEENVVTVAAHGFSGSLIFKATLNSSKDAIETLTVDWSNENNLPDGITEADFATATAKVQALEEVEVVSGATYTSHAFQNAKAVLAEYLTK